MTEGLRGALLEQRERMAVLGTLAAGLAHELKNPAAAANRALALLGDEFSALEPLARRLAEHPWSAGEVALLRRLEEATLAIDQSARELDAVARGDREEGLVTWLERHEVEGSSDLAPLLADRGITPEQLDRLAKGCDASILADALAWTRHAAMIRQLLAEAAQSTSRITEIVRAVKAYSYVDATAQHAADVHDGLETGLTILGHKLRESRAVVVREYDRTLPPVPSYGTELGQLWTNLFDNAADAVAAAGGGTVRVRTYRDGEQAAVEISDTGGGIAPELRAKIFDPFFTTKGAGKGTGLGLEIAKRIVTGHGGTIDLASDAGTTRFTVRLPLQNDGSEQGHVGGSIARNTVARGG